MEAAINPEVPEMEPISVLFARSISRRYTGLGLVTSGFPLFILAPILLLATGILRRHWNLAELFYSLPHSIPLREATKSVYESKPTNIQSCSIEKTRNINIYIQRLLASSGTVQKRIPGRNHRDTRAAVRSSGLQMSVIWEMSPLFTQIFPWSITPGRSTITSIFDNVLQVYPDSSETESILHRIYEAREPAEPREARLPQKEQFTTLNSKIMVLQSARSSEKLSSGDTSISMLLWTNISRYIPHEIIKRSKALSNRLSMTGGKPTRGFDPTSKTLDFTSPVAPVTNHLQTRARESDTRDNRFGGGTLSNFDAETNWRVSPDIFQKAKPASELQAPPGSELILKRKTPHVKRDEESVEEKTVSRLPVAAPQPIAIDTDRLADQVYRIIERRIRIQRERRGM
jgi:hypothetical protein